MCLLEIWECVVIFRYLNIFLNFCNKFLLDGNILGGDLIILMWLDLVRKYFIFGISENN